MLGSYRFEGHAIVSADDKIADANGVKPPELNHPADWKRFQAALDQAALILIGRKSHEASPGRPGRRRLIVSSSSPALEERADGWWWNPAKASLEDALVAAAPAGGVVAIPGGRGVFDLFAKIGFDAFNLVRLPTVLLPGGIPIFSAYDEGLSPEAVLDEAGLSPGAIRVLDARVGLTVTIWRPD